jgi:hypothetical protein
VILAFLLGIASADFAAEAVSFADGLRPETEL